MPEIEFDVRVHRCNSDQIVKMIEERLEKMRESIWNRPSEVAGASSYHVQDWLRRFMAAYGRVLGMIETLALLGEIPAEMAIDLNRRAQLLLQFHSGKVILGAD